MIVGGSSATTAAAAAAANDRTSKMNFTFIQINMSISLLYSLILIGTVSNVSGKPIHEQPDGLDGDPLDLSRAGHLPAQLGHQQQPHGQILAGQTLGLAARQTRQGPRLSSNCDPTSASSCADRLPAPIASRRPKRAQVGRREPRERSRLFKRSGISDQRLAEIQMIRALKKQLEKASKLAAANGNEQQAQQQAAGD